MKATNARLPETDPCYCIGLLSGTSLDAISAALVQWPHFKLEATHQHPIPLDFKTQCLNFTVTGQADFNTLLHLHVYFGHLLAEAVNALLQKSSIDRSKVAAIGSHGQTIYHLPSGPFPYSLQIGDPHVIAHQTNILTVADFRNADLAAGGQGAPLAPLLHSALFKSPLENRTIINLGGIANVTHLPKNPEEPLLGFDTGPGNALSDAWIQKNLNQAFDHGGQWAASGTVIPELLEALLADDYFQQIYPKSSGKELFNLPWLEHRGLNTAQPGSYAPQDVQATLIELTVEGLKTAIAMLPPSSKPAFYACGGGVHNQYLMKRLAQGLGSPVQTTAALGSDPDWIEAVLFAWLAYKRIRQERVDLRSVTGSVKKVLLGAIFE